MSEYQYYEFQAVDRPLDEDEQAAVRALSTRATITAGSFVNEYHWGDFSGDPSRLMELYYDAHLYTANWGTRRCMFRLPDSVLDPDVVERYLIDDQVSAWTAGEHVILDLSSEDDADEFDGEPTGTLASVLGARSEIAAGDMRALYLAWLAGVGTWERYEDAFEREFDDEPEPPVPAGLRHLTAAQRSLADFLRLDADLLDVATEASPDPGDTDDGLAAWVATLAAAEKDELLARVADGQEAMVRSQLLRRFHTESDTPATAPTRTVADLLDAAARRRAQRTTMTP